MKETVDFSALVKSAKNGDESAFKELYDATIQNSYHAAKRLLKNHEDIEDVLQNAYMRAAKNLSELKNPESFGGWIKTIVENESKNYIKKEKRIQVPVLFFKNKPNDAEEWKQPVPQEFMEREELREHVTKILDGLSPEVRACIVLFHYEDKSLNEISEILDIPLGTVKSRLHNGRKQIEREFKKLLKKDPTLYGIGAIPLVLSLMAYQAENVAVPAAISEGVASTAATSAGATASAGASVSAGVASATGATTAVSAGAGTAAATTIAVKVAAVAVAGSVAVGGTAAIKNQVDKNRAEEYVSSTALVTTVKTEETCTVAESLTQATTVQELSAVISTVLSSTATTRNAVTSTVIATQETTAEISAEEKTTKKKGTTTRRHSTTAATKPTTTRIVTTTKLTTTKETTTEETTEEETTEETTTRKVTTTKKPTTTRKPTTTQRPTTTAAPTTNPEDNYGASGGVITEYTGNESNVSIPSKIGSQTVTAIGAGAFSGNEDIKSVSLPSTVTQVGQEAFSDCTSLSSVSLPSSLRQIGIGAFYGCSSLSSVTVPGGTTSIGDEAFAYCTSLRSVTIPSSVTSIADDAFTGCDSLTIKCEEGSAAHDFAVANSIDFVLT